MYNVVIPCAGEGSRFGFKFKPLIYLDSRTFIEHCLDNFIKYDNMILKYYFILKYEDSIKYDFKNFLIKKFPKQAEKMIIMENKFKTSGPYQTLYFLIKNISLKNIMFCDCDHSIDIKPIIEKPKNTNIIIPLWNINLNEHENWGKVVMEDNKIIDFFEKEILPDKIVYGIIGCYYISDSKILIENNKLINFTDFLKNYHKQITIDYIHIKNAYFFGTPNMVKKAIEYRRNLETVIIDIDGVILKHNPHSNEIIENNELILNTKQILETLYNEKMIIIMSSRSELIEENLKKLLSHFNIKYDKLILGVNPGTRYIINDIKPSNIFTRQAVAYNVQRDAGIEGLDFTENNNNKIEIIEKLKGGSFSDTYLIKNNLNELVVRKCIIKNKNNVIHYEKLKRQCEDIKRFYYYNNLTPQIFKEYDCDYYYYYDMEYLNNYNNLDNYNEDIIEKVLTNLIDNLRLNLYDIRRNIKTDNFWLEFIKEKIKPKFDFYEKENNRFDYLINSEKIKINNKEFFGLRKIFNNINFSELEPNYLSPIHGDLTLENILFNIEENVYKIIDMDGSRYLDFPGFDLGKLYQSLVSNFKEWKNNDKLIFEFLCEENILCEEKYFDFDFININYLNKQYSIILNKNFEQTIKIGILCMATYFIRFIPFMIKINENKALFSLILSIVWLTKLLN